MNMKIKISPFFILYFALFISLLVYAYFFFKPELYYFNKQQLFLFDKEYFKGFLIYPGGISEYLTNFIFQFYYYKIVGACLFSLFLLLIFFLINKIFKQFINSIYSIIFSFFPLIFFLIFQSQYDYNIVISVKFIICLLFFLLYLRVYKLSFIKYLFAILSSALIYYIAGGLFFLFHILLMFSYEVIYFRDNKFKILSLIYYLLIGLVFPYLSARYYFIITYKEAYRYVTPYQDDFSLEILIYLLLFFVPLLFVFAKTFAKGSTEIKPGKKVISLITVASCVFSLVFLFAFTDSDKKQKIKIDYLAYNNQWEQIINSDIKISRDEILKNYNLNFYNYLNISRALYHTNQLLDHLFDYEQLYDVGGLFANIYVPETAIPAGFLYFDLGQVMTAQRYFYEALTNFPYDPRIYKMLVRINLISRNYALADKYLYILHRSIIYRSWADDYRKFINNNELSDNESLFSEKRNCLPKFHYFSLVDINKPDWDLKNLLNANNNNKMAFEYLMAYYLLTNNYDEIIANLKHFKDFNYPNLPKHIAEAILVYKLLFPKKWEELPNREDIKISAQTLDQFDNFNRIIDECGNNMEKAKSMLPLELKNTYWYFLRFTTAELEFFKPQKAKKDEY